MCQALLIPSLATLSLSSVVCRGSLVPLPPSTQGFQAREPAAGFDIAPGAAGVGIGPAAAVPAAAAEGFTSNGFGSAPPMMGSNPGLSLGGPPLAGASPV